MRTIVATMVGLAFLALGCNGSKGGSTTTGSGGETTGGTTPLAAGQPCASDGDCASGVCGVSLSGGNCCAQSCPLGKAPCTVSGCDENGACDYPGPETSCDTTCTGAALNQNACNGGGGCQAVSATACPDHFSCPDGGEATGDDAGCQTTCTSGADCATGFVCNAGGCVAPVPTGACTEDDDCSSGACGVTGSGHCCRVTCTGSTPPCGAADCDPQTGACLYGDSATACGSTPQSCSGTTELSPSHCDGVGNCGTVATSCAPYACGATTCLTTCSDGGGCASGAFCELSHASCCGLTFGGAMAVDAVTGNDQVACCGVAGNQPCQTIAHALQLIDAARAHDVTLTATLNDAGGDWAPPGETFPILLGWGVELNAPGITFFDRDGGGIFTIGSISSNDLIGYASIVGARGNPIGIGMDQAGDQSQGLHVIEVQADQTLFLANASINGNADFLTTAIHLEPGAALYFGGDRTSAITGQAKITGRVNIGSSSGPPGYDGIVCTAGPRRQGCMIMDVPLQGESSVVIQGQAGRDLDLEGNSFVTLTSAPVIGTPPSSVGFLTCPGSPLKADNEGVLLNGLITMEFDNGTVQCLSGYGFLLQSTALGVPTLMMNGTTIQNTQIGIQAFAGTAVISNSTIRYNANGVEQAYTGRYTATIDLSGGPDGGRNTVACSNSIEGYAPPGVSVLNKNSQALNASNVNWDTPAPDLFGCNASLDACTCEISSCSLDAGADGMDAVYTSTGSITTTGNQLSTLDCTPPSKY